MARLTVFNSVTVDGYFTGENGDLSWAHTVPQDAEWNAFVAENASAGGALVLGRVTYDMMASFWPTAAALENAPIVAERMNSMPKFVFSRSLEKPTWSNTKVIKGDVVAELKKLKQASGEDMTILGSGSIVSQVAPAGLVDEYQFVEVPVVLGKGRTMFDGVENALKLKRTRTRAFGNGNVLLCYAPVSSTGG